MKILAATPLVAFLLGGCGDDNPVRPQPPAPFQYLAPTSPGNVLQNLVAAYMNRDSVQTAVVYDDQYVGTTTDPSNPTPIPDFSKSDEVRHVARLKTDPNLVSVFLDLGLFSSWQRLSASGGDPADWAVIQITSSTIRVEDISTATTWSTGNNVMEYKFKPTVAAPGDTTWAVIRWSELAN